MQTASDRLLKEALRRFVMSRVRVTAAAVVAVVGFVVWVLVTVPRYQVRGVTLQGKDTSAQTAAPFCQYG
jgi:hypothetical protein